MILILSHEHIDEPTNTIIDWLSFYNARFLRLNGDDFLQNKYVKIDINNTTVITNYGQVINSNEISIVWYRRWIKPTEKKTFFEKFKQLNFTNEEALLVETYDKYLQKESTTYVNGIFSVFKDKLWIPKPSKARGNINKLDVLLRAKDIGMKIPNTIVTSSKKEVALFLKANGSIITKPIYEANCFDYKGESAPMYTKEVSENDVKAFPQLFFPSLFQKKIDKQFEIRTFIHRNKVYSMAMFSQNDVQTSIDFRNYNWVKPNRYVPFKLPQKEEEKLLKLLNDLDLNTGSIDLIYDDKGNYVFLEINPVGQFGMVSINCNYNLEKIIANDLIALSNEQKRTDERDN
ncbi:grasp-with-spasm system ATP-grasp peptide maturase [Flavobacterium supellecticarium]|uniref:Grasp-with-spasm system ATP-grasp peptide maturase n=1 Tax=Flavobacterium supellecticarium TaxID=2565924 RepID=A0A4S4A061_9FLAO|nr:grasp-with-spasm system ATP-grasp peptide maturase [Flavobacterium supellecticarium]THF51577.1 grasp-with-spasm system ATP-grasp peptide maturase [Flavobacterium supellecticarium]